MLISSFWKCIYELFIKNMSLEDIINNCKIICQFMNRKKILGFKAVWILSRQLFFNNWLVKTNYKEVKFASHIGLGFCFIK